MAQRLFQGFAVLSIVEAGLLLVLGVAPLLLLDAGGSPLDWVRDSSWPLLSLMALIYTGLMPFVLIGLYACRIERVGSFGLVGLVIALVGVLLYFCFQFDLAFVWPVLASNAPELVAYDGPMFRAPRFAFVHFWMGIVYMIGFLSFGIAIVKARVFPRTAGVLFTIGMILTAGILFPPLVIRMVGALLGAPAVAWMGLVQWKEAQRCSQTTEAHWQQTGQ